MFENVVATFVDVGSIMVAYTVGIHQFNIFVGLAYGCLDAILVVWMRKPLSRAVRHVLDLRKSRVERTALPEMA